MAINVNDSKLTRNVVMIYITQSGAEDKIIGKIKAFCCYSLDLAPN